MSMILFVLCFAAVALVLRQGVMATVAQSVSGEITASGNRVVNYETAVKAQPTILAAQPGTLTVRSSGTAGTLVMDNSGHGITTGDYVDLYWDGGQCYRAHVGTVSGTTVPILTVAGGTALPVITTVINVGVVNQAPFGFDGDNVQVLVFTVQASGYIVLIDKVGTAQTVKLATYVTAGQAYIWDVDNGLTNPLAAFDITHANFSQSVTSQTATQNKAFAGVN